MSKLSKFNSKISAEEGAKLLSRLIGEEVTIGGLEMLHTQDWLTSNATCFATLVKLSPALPPDEHAKQVEFGRYFMRAEEPCGICVGIDLPLDQVDIEGAGRGYVLRDEAGGFYALRDRDTNSFLSDIHDSVPFFEDRRLYPNEIYELALLANGDEPAPERKVIVKRNDGCVCAFALYNFPPDTDATVKSHQPVAIQLPPQPPQDSPSFVLAVAALLELATTRAKKNRTQASLIEEVLDGYQYRGLSKSNLEKMFSQANRRLAEAKAAGE